MALNRTDPAGVTGEGGFSIPRPEITRNRQNAIERSGCFIVHGGDHPGTKSSVPSDTVRQRKRKAEKRARRRKY